MLTGGDLAGLACKSLINFAWRTPMFRQSAAHPAGKIRGQLQYALISSKLFLRHCRRAFAFFTAIPRAVNFLGILKRRMMPSQLRRVSATSRPAPRRATPPSRLYSGEPKTYVTVRQIIAKASIFTWASRMAFFTASGSCPSMSCTTCQCRLQNVWRYRR